MISNKIMEAIDIKIYQLFNFNEPVHTSLTKKLNGIVFVLFSNIRYLHNSLLFLNNSINNF